jgi:histidyl-tRNA synthetase
VLKLVCHGPEAPVELASGGRYDALVGRFCADPSLAAGMGFGLFPRKNDRRLVRYRYGMR